MGFYNYVPAIGAAVYGVTIGQARDPSEGLVAHWKMDEDYWNGVADEVLDDTGNANHLVANANATSTAKGKFARGGTFDGSGDYLCASDGSGNCEDDNDLDVGTASFTIAGWFRHANISAADYIIAKHEAGVAGGYKVYMDADGDIAFAIDDDGTWGPEDVVGDDQSKNYDDDTWHHFAAVKDSTSAIYVYVDGTQIDSDTSLTATGTLSNATSTYLGIDIVAAGPTSSWDGEIDDIKIYNQARDADQIRRDYESGPPPVAHWKFDEKTGQTAYDTASSSDGTLGADANAGTDDPTWKGSGQCQYGNCLDFDGTDDYVDAGNITGDARTISFWAKLDSTTEKILAVNADQYIEASSGTLDLIGDSSETIYVDGVESTTIDTNWHHIAVVASSTMITNDVEIGRQSTNYCDGLIDDVRIYNYARDQKQIIQDMMAGAPLVGGPRATTRVAPTVGHWSFDEGYGTTAYDESMHDNDLTLSAASSTDGKFGSGLDASGEQWASRADDADFDVAAGDDYSISLWFKSDSASNPGATEYLIDKESSSAGYAIYAETDGDIVFGIDDDATWGPDDTAGNIGTDYYDGAWHHAVAVKTATSSIEMYIDGVQIEKDSSIAATATLANAAALVIGDRDASDDGDEFTGDIDEVKLYRFALSPAEIRQIYNQGASLALGAKSTASDGVTPSLATSREYCVPGDTSTCDPPVGHWKLDEKTGQTAYDTASTTNDGTLGASAAAGSDDPTWKGSGDCQYGNCLDFDGSDDYVDTGSIAGNARTISFWAKLDSTTEKILAVNAGQYIEASSGTLDLAGDSSETIYVDGVESTTIDTNWHHIAVVASSTMSTSDVEIGRQSTNYYDGLIDDVRIYDYARTPAQIAWDYNRGKPIAHWNFDEGQDTATTCDAALSTIYDYSEPCVERATNCNNGTASTTVPVVGKFNCAAYFEAVETAYIDVGDLGIDDNLRSLSFWVNASSTTESIIDLDGTYYVDVSSGTVDLNGTTTETIYVDGVQTTTLTTGWHNVAITMPDTESIDPTDADLGRVSTTYLDGMLDDVRFYTYPLTAAQVKQIYNQGAVRFGPSSGLP